MPCATQDWQVLQWMQGQPDTAGQAAICRGNTRAWCGATKACRDQPLLFSMSEIVLGKPRGPVRPGALAEQEECLPLVTC